MSTTGKVTGIIANLVTVEVNGPVAQNEICYIKLGETKLDVAYFILCNRTINLYCYQVGNDTCNFSCGTHIFILF